MAYLTLIVKGTKQDVGTALNAHGVRAKYIVPITVGGTYCVTTYDLDDVENVRRWFGEGDGKAPYPKGTLLLFTHHDGQR